MTILITGANGFIGKNLLKYILQNNIFSNDEIILLSSNFINGYKCILHKNYQFTKEDFIENGVNNIDIVIHLGAASPKKSNETGIEYCSKYTMNIVNTVHLLNNLPQIPKQFIFISTTSVYEPAPIINESTAIQTSDIYGLSKFMCEEYLKQNSKKLNFALKILRLGQIYGEGEEAYSKIVSFFTSQIINDKPITIFGNGKELRSMLYVQDCVKYIIASLNPDINSGIYNIASSQSISVIDLVNNIYSFCNKSPNITFREDIKTNNIIYDTQKAQQYFKIQETPIFEGIKNYITYYRNEVIK